MKVKRLYAILFILIGVAGVLAGPVEEKGNRLRRKAPLTTEKQMTVEVTSYTGNFYLYPGDPQLAYDLSIHYESEPPIVTYNRLGERGYLHINTKAFSKKDEEENKSTEEFNFENQDCELYVTPAIPLDLRLKFGVVQGELELGGLQVKTMHLSAGVSKTMVVFSEPNPIPLLEMQIESGVGKLKMEKLGNANFQSLEFEGGIGASVLDFSGDFQQNAQLNFNVGIGKVTLYLPRKIGVRIKINKSFFSSVTIDEVYKRGKYYYNENWGKTSASMDISINAGIGRVVVEWIED